MKLITILHHLVIIILTQAKFFKIGILINKRYKNISLKPKLSYDNILLKEL